MSGKGRYRRVILLALIGCALAAVSAAAAETLYPAMDGGKWGYITKEGEIAVPPRFARAFPFLETGFAPVYLHAPDGDEPFCMVDTKGGIAVRMEDWRLDTKENEVDCYEDEKAAAAGNAVLLRSALIYPKYALYLTDSGKLIELDNRFLGLEPKGRELRDYFYYRSFHYSEPTFFELDAWGENLVLSFCLDDFRYDVLEHKVKADSRGLCVVLDKEGKKTHDGLYTREELKGLGWPGDGDSAESSLQWIDVAGGEGESYLAAADGKRLSPQDVYVYEEARPDGFPEGLAPVMATGDNDRLDFMDASGRLLFGHFPFEKVEKFSGGLARVSVMDEDFMVLDAYIEAGGKVVWAAGGRTENVRRMLAEGITYSPKQITQEDARRLLVGEWTCSGGGEHLGEPVIFNADGTTENKDVVWRVIANPLKGDAEDDIGLGLPFILQFGKPGLLTEPPAVKGDDSTYEIGLDVFGSNGFGVTDAAGGSSYARAAEGYWKNKTAEKADENDILPRFERFDETKQIPFGVLAFRGSPNRENAYSVRMGKVGKLSLLWQTPIGPAAEQEEPLWQPLIVKWSREARAGSNIFENKKEVQALKEVIAVGTDRRIHFFDLADGAETREPIDGSRFEFTGTPALHDCGLPVLFAPSRAGLKCYNLLNQSLLAADEAFGANEDTTPVVRHHLILTNEGALRVEFGFDVEKDEIKSIIPKDLKRGWHHYFDSPVSADGAAVWGDSHSGYVRRSRLQKDDKKAEYWTGRADGDCGGQIGAAIAVDGGNRPSLYAGETNIGNSLDECGIHKINGDDMSRAWYRAFSVRQNERLPNGCVASPVSGEYELSRWVYFTVTGLRQDDFIEAWLFGKTSAEAELVALDKATGDIVWRFPMNARAVSSPIAVYEDTGKGYLVQADGAGRVYLLDGATGECLSQVNVGGGVFSAVAGYKNMVVLRCSAGDTEMLCGIAVGEE